MGEDEDEDAEDPTGPETVFSLESPVDLSTPSQWVEVITEGAGLNVRIDEIDALVRELSDRHRDHAAFAGAEALVADTSEALEIESLPAEVDVESEADAEPDEQPAVLLSPDELPPELAAELREFDFYFDNGLPDAARSVLEDLPAEYREHDEVARRRQKLSD